MSAPHQLSAGDFVEGNVLTGTSNEARRFVDIHDVATWRSVMRKFVSTALLSALLAAFTLPALAQTTTGPQSCKPDETWDAGMKMCMPKR
jgi:hypothetical protein